MTTDASATPTPVPPTLPSAAPWYAEGSTADFSMSELFTFALVLDGLDAFEDVSGVLYYFEKPWKWTGEHGRWVELKKPAIMNEDEGEYVLDNGTKAASFADWLKARDEGDEEMAVKVTSIVGNIVKKAGGK